MSKKNKVNSTNNQVKINPKSETNYYDIISLLFLICFLGIDFLPLFKSIEIIGPQFLYLSVLNVIIGLYIYNNPSLISERLIVLCKRSQVLKLYFLLIFLSGISILFANNSSLGIVNFSRLIIILFTLLNFLVLFYNRLHLIYKIAFILSISVFAQSFSEIFNFVKILKTDSVTMALRSLKGNTGSINILASTICLKTPFILIAIFHYDNWKKWFLIITFFLASSLIFLSGSRATYLSLFLVILFFSIPFFKNLYFKNKKSILRNSLVILIPIFLSFIISNQLFKSSNDKGRYESVTSRVKQATNIKNNKSNVRLMYWKNAINMIELNPITGIGLGNWKIESIPYEKIISKERVISNNTHNDFLEVMSETGILNGLVFISLFVILFYINLKRILKSRKTELNIVALVSMLCLISYSVDSTFNFPLYRPTMQLVFCLVFALSILNTSTGEESKTSFYGNKYAILLIIISLATTYLSYKIFKAYQLENDIRANFVTKNFNLKAGQIVSELPDYPNVFTSGEPYATYVGKYFIQEKNYEQATKYLNIGHKINPYLGRTEYYKSIIAKDNGKLDSALVYSKKALEIRPRVKDYYIQAINAAIGVNDVKTILEIHKMYTQFTNNPEIWINTSSALSIVKYENKKLIEFINEGLKMFPENALLLERKELFETNSNKINSDNYTKKAIQYFKEKKYRKSLEELQKALKVDPNNPRVIKNIAICKSMIK